MDDSQCDVGLAVLGPRTAEKAYWQSVTAPAQLKVTVSTQPLSVLMPKAMGTLSVLHGTPGGA